MADSFLFIPDITGFTKFVNSTEIEHGQHIISELLEGIIESNQLDLVVSEVEGDAVLFYKHNTIPTFEELVSQSEKIFITFHEQLKQLEAHRICQCGACSSAINLSIKIAAHSGAIGFTKVLNHEKPYGADVVKIHTLLKNNVNEKEYVLLSDSLSETYKKELEQVSIAWVKPNSTPSSEGESQHHYFSLFPLFEHVREPVRPKPPERLPDPYVTSIYIERPKEHVFEVLINLDVRKLWNEEAKEVIYDEHKVNRVGASHQCVLNDNSVINFESFTDEIGEGKLIYGEKILGIKMAREVAVFFIVENESNGARLILELHIKPLPVIGWLIKSLMLYKMSGTLKDQLNSLKSLAERQ
ncbi:MAG: DUF2652 domain-containing protein [Cyclobacteriaceae bacterium]